MPYHHQAVSVPRRGAFFRAFEWSGRAPMSVRPSACTSATTTGRISVKIYIWDFLKMRSWIWNLTKIGQKLNTHFV